ncbi:CD59 glycoprotein [Orchesella cincta]|uniref:CD59 glycoprotein n=1 Tax=Orchesella cincta TaxID=48709 RepID=A0A1D2MS73_ORCCI|nr:CD59 glycoprotein [Orchesella cincta]
MCAFRDNLPKQDKIAPTTGGDASGTLRDSASEFLHPTCSAEDELETEDEYQTEAQTPAAVTRPYLEGITQKYYRIVPQLSPSKTYTVTRKPRGMGELGGCAPVKEIYVIQASFQLMGLPSPPQVNCSSSCFSRKPFSRLFPAIKSASESSCTPPILLQQDVFAPAHGARGADDLLRDSPSGGVHSTRSSLRCYNCDPCGNNTDLGGIQECGAGQDYCVFGQVEQPDETLTAHRSCATHEFTQEYSCKTFTTAKDKPEKKYRPCACKGDLCNNKDVTIGAFSTQLLPFRILMAVSVFGLLMIN